MNHLSTVHLPRVCDGTRPAIHECDWNDGDLADRLRTGDETMATAALEEFDRLHRRTFLRESQSRLGDFAAAECCVQLALLGLWQMRKELPGNTGFSLTTYFRGILSHKRVDYLRRNRRHGQVFEDEVAARTASYDPVQSALLTELQGDLLEAVSRLGPEQREVFICVDQKGLSYEETSEHLEIPVSTVKMRLHHARLKLRIDLRSKHAPEVTVHAAVSAGMGEGAFVPALAA